MTEHSINIEVAYAKPDKQLIIPVKLAEGSSVWQAIVKSGILERFTEIDLLKINIGIFGKSCQLEKIVGQGDRVEIYRPLLQNPMDARRHRAVKGGIGVKSKKSIKTKKQNPRY